MKLTVIMLDTYRTQIAIGYENEHRPYGRRAVQIELTPEQMELLKPRKVGERGATDVYEEYGYSWLEA